MTLVIAARRRCFFTTFKRPTPTGMSALLSSWRHHGGGGGGRCAFSASSTSLLSQQQHASSSSSSSSSSFTLNWRNANAIVAAIASSLPLLIWANDALFGLVRVEGKSMEPTLLHGDVILVRKADAGFLVNLLAHGIFGKTHDDDTDDDASSSILAREQRRIRQYEMAINGGFVVQDYGATAGHSSSANIYENPPLVVAGQVVVLASPETAFPTEFIVKRVIGVGGQWLQLPPPPVALKGKNNRPHQHYPMMQQRIQLLPPYSLYVQGDDDQNNNSRDSRHYGPISKNLIIGVAEYVVWPPTRWQRITRHGRCYDGPNDDDNDDNDDSSRRPHMRRAFWR